RVLFLVKQVLDLEEEFDLLPPVHPVPGPGLFRADRRKLGFPISQNVWLDADEAAHFPDAKVELIRNLSEIGAGIGAGHLLRHPSALGPGSSLLGTDPYRKSPRRQASRPSGSARRPAAKPTSVRRQTTRPCRCGHRRRAAPCTISPRSTRPDLRS